MSSPWPLSANRSTYYASSKTSPMTPRPHPNAVPVGTVASRIIHLQNLATASIFNRSNAVRPWDNGRTGFGRRTSSRFGVPAVQNSKPNERSSQVDDGHSFLGLATPRANHTEEHALADQDTKWDRTIGLHGQVKPQGIESRAQYDATSPWAVMRQSKSQMNVRKEYSQHEVDVLKASRSASKLNGASETKSMPRPKTGLGVGSSSVPQKGSSGLKSGFMTCETASQSTLKPEGHARVETPYDVRRQSVRDLYMEYGILRPEGLVSSENLSYNGSENPKPARKHRSCHVCGWLNGPGTNCWRCRHLFCKQCDDLSPEPTPFASDSYDNLPKEPAGSRSLQSLVYDVLEQKTPLAKESPPKSSSQQTVKRYKPNRGITSKHTEEVSTQAKKVPSLHVDEATPRRGSRKTPPTYITMLSTTAPPLPKEQETRKSCSKVKDSPFYVADVLSSNPSLGLLPISVKVTRHSVHHHGSHRDNHNANNHTHLASNSTEVGDYDSLGCKTIHSGYRPYNHSISCSRGHYRRPEETDSCYIAGKIHHEDHLQHDQHDQHHQSHRMDHQNHSREGFHHADHQEAHSSNHRHSLIHSHTHEHHPQNSHSFHSANLVQCSDYPRTIHANYESSTASGNIGDCQHFLGDCQSEACLNTHHNIRDCVNYDHQAVIHNHHTPRKGPPGLAIPPPHSSFTPELAPPPFPPPPPPLETQPLKPGSSDGARGPVLMPTPRRSIRSPPWLTEDTVAEPEHQFWQTMVSTPTGKLRDRTLASSKKTEVDTLWKSSLSNKVSRQVAALKEPPFPPKTTESLPQKAASSNIRTKLHSYLTSDSPGRDAATETRSPLPISSTLPKARILSSPSVTTTPNSRKVSRRLSALFAKLQEKSTVPLLSRRLQEHQQELKRIEKMCDDGLEVVAESRSSDEGKSKRKGWRIKLKDKKSPPLPERNLVKSPHVLGDCDTVEGIGDTTHSPLVSFDKSTRNRAHDFSWKEVAVEKNKTREGPNNETLEQDDENESFGDVGINAISIIIHLKGKEDLMFKTDLKSIL